MTPREARAAAAERERVRQMRVVSARNRLAKDLQWAMERPPSFIGPPRVGVQWLYGEELRSLVYGHRAPPSFNDRATLAVQAYAKSVLTRSSLIVKPFPYGDSDHTGFLRVGVGSLYTKLKELGLYERTLFFAPDLIMVIDMVARKLKATSRSWAISEAFSKEVRP